MPPSTPITDSDSAIDGMRIMALRMILPAMTRRVIWAMFTPRRFARLVRNCSSRAPVKSEASPAMVKSNVTKYEKPPPGAPGGNAGSGGEGGGGDGTVSGRADPVGVGSESSEGTVSGRADSESAGIRKRVRTEVGWLFFVERTAFFRLHA